MVNYFLLLLKHSAKTIKFKFKNILLKLTFLGKQKKKTTEINTKIPESDEDQWKRMRTTMKGTKPEENLDNNTSLFDRILVTNTFARGKNKFIYN